MPLRAFQELGFSDFDSLYSKAKQDHLFDGLETVDLALPSSVMHTPTLPAGHHRSAIDTCWNSMLGSVPQERIHLVERLKERYQVLLLSNTNAIHVPAFEAIIARENGVAHFADLFHGAYYSCEIGLRKPDAASFLHVLEKHEADPARTLFIDDSIQHVLGARRQGYAEHLELEKEEADRTCRIG
ncbi:MAG: HAD-IA family hydrolase [Flavobacteriales bacterium]|nr:HAD-IA family hydrolase [Flavobacteriales bacterium]